ncbi:TRAP transporter permease [Chloroflexota bacterium]
MAEISRIGTGRTKVFWRVVISLSCAASIILAICHIFAIAPFGFQMIDNAYLYALMASLLSLTFIAFPATKGRQNRIMWYDVLLWFLTVAICSYFIIISYDIIHKGWAFAAPLSITAVSFVLLIIILEAVRRAGGKALFIFLLFAAFFPLYAPYMPGPLEGQGFNFWQMVNYHILSIDSVLGLILQTFGNLVVGYMFFGVILVASGGGEFFLNFALALFGTSRGGPAKVSIVSSGLFGSLSGAVLPNVITTGSMTIPAMKKAGYPPYYAAAIESCASTGGCIMPPVMGAVAFIMAGMLGIDYITIAMAAAIPALMYYMALFLQVDAYAARVGLKGVSKEDIPRIWDTLKTGWIYFFSLIILIYLLYLRLTGEAPFIAASVLLISALIKKDIRHNLRQFFYRLAEDTGRTLSNIIAILAACGLLMGAFAMTGVGHSLSREIVMLAHGNMVLLLITGAIASSILGMGMTITPCYIFLAIVLAPSLIQTGLHVLAVHLFVLYWGLASFLTPPVALAAYMAAGIAKAPPLKTGVQAMRLGIILYIIPFFFVLSPALILQGTIEESILVIASCVVGIVLLAGGLEGYLLGVGRLSVPFRISLIVSGLLLGFPETQSDIAGICIAAFTILVHVAMQKRLNRPGSSTQIGI